MKIGSNAQCTLSIIEAANTMVYSLNPSNYYNDFDLSLFNQGVSAHEEQEKISATVDGTLNFYPAMLYRYALFSYISKDINGAVRAINEALSLAPNNLNIRNLHTEIHNYKQEIFDRLNQSVTAGKKNALYVMPVVVYSLLKLAEIMQLDQNHEQAISYAKQALELCPKHTEANRIYNESHKHIIMQDISNSNYDEMIKRYPKLTCKDMQAEILSILVQRYIDNNRTKTLKRILMSQTQLMVGNIALTIDNIAKVTGLIRNSIYIREISIAADIAPDVFNQLSEAIKFNIFLHKVEINLKNVSLENATHLFKIIAAHQSVLLFNFHTDDNKCKKLASTILPSNTRLLGYHVNTEYFVCAKNFVSNMCKLEKAIYQCKGKFNSITLSSYSPIFILQRWKGISSAPYLDKCVDFLVRTRSEIMLTLYSTTLPSSIIHVLELYILDSEKCGSIKTTSLQITS